MSNVRSVGTIYSWIRELLKPGNPDAVKSGHPVENYVTGGQAAVDAFVVGVMNRDSRFERDGLNLAPSDVPNSPKVFNLIAAAADDYEARGWTVKW